MPKRVESGARGVSELAGACRSARGGSKVSRPGIRWRCTSVRAGAVRAEVAALDADQLTVRLAWPDGHSTGRHGSAGQTPPRPLTSGFQIRVQRRELLRLAAENAAGCGSRGHLMPQGPTARSARAASHRLRSIILALPPNTVHRPGTASVDPVERLTIELVDAFPPHPHVAALVGKKKVATCPTSSPSFVV